MKTAVGTKIKRKNKSPNISKKTNLKRSMHPHVHLFHYLQQPRYGNNPSAHQKMNR